MASAGRYEAGGSAESEFGYYIETVRTGGSMGHGNGSVDDYII